MNLARLLKKRPWGIAGAVLLFIVVVLAVFSPLIATHNYNDMNLRDRLQPPGGDHLLGSDNLGRDVFSRLVYGARPYVLAAGIATGIALVLGLILGAIFAVSKTKNDSWLRILLTVLAGLAAVGVLFIALRLVFPYLLTLLKYMMNDGRLTLPAMILFVSILVSFMLLPVMYHSMFTAFSRRSSPGHVIATILVCFGISIGLALFVIAPMSYLGIGVPPPFPEWGSSISGSGRQYLITAPWMALYPRIAIGVVVLGTVLFGAATYEFWLPRVSTPRVKVAETTASQPSN